MQFGLNLFSLRTLIKDEKGFLDTAEKLKKMGYSYLQYSGGPYDPDVIARVSRESDMPVVLTHVPMQRLIDEPEALMEEHAKFGCRNIGLGAMDPKIIAEKDVFYATVEKLERSAIKMRENGYKFFYHNHHFEFFKHDGVTVFDYMIQNAPHINFTLDTYWVQHGGADVVDHISKLFGRIECVHLKDYAIVCNKDGDSVSFVQSCAPVGDGTLDFHAIIREMIAADAKYFLVEQDNAVDFADPLDQVERSIKYLKKEFKK